MQDLVPVDRATNREERTPFGLPRPRQTLNVVGIWRGVRALRYHSLSAIFLESIPVQVHELGRQEKGCSSRTLTVI